VRAPRSIAVPAALRPMQGQWQHHVDADEPDAHGCHRYFYAYTLYAFADAGAVLHARRYDDTTDTVSLLGWGVNGERRLSESDLAHPLVKKAVHWLRADGATQLLWLERKSGSYLTIEA
jgi:hypothetical protein